MTSSSAPNGKEDATTALDAASEISSELSQLASLLAQDELAESDVEELLRRMDTADVMAQGLESRLEGMIDNLDELLKTLERGGEAGDGSSVERTNHTADTADKSKSEAAGR